MCNVDKFHRRLFASSIKREIKHFHVVVMQQRQRNVQKSVKHVQTDCFNLLLFWRQSSCRRRRRRKFLRTYVSRKNYLTLEISPKMYEESPVNVKVERSKFTSVNFTRVRT